MSTRVLHPRPHALMLLGTHCPYCPTVLRGLSELIKSGAISRLNAVNIEHYPEVARTLGVRTVPWVRIGPFELEGLRSEGELRGWAEAAGTERGYASYIDELLSAGKIDRAIKLIQNNPDAINALLLLFSNPETHLSTHIGISAVVESLAGSELLNGIVDRLGVLSQHDDPRIRGDAAHYLGLTGSDKAAVYIKNLLDDADADIRAVARESMDLLKG